MHSSRVKALFNKRELEGEYNKWEEGKIFGIDINTLVERRDSRQRSGIKPKDNETTLLT